MGCGIFPSRAQAPALATGPASNQEERRCPVSGGRQGRADPTAKHCALGGCGFGPGPALEELILQGSHEAAALWGDPGHCGEGRRQEVAWVQCLQETEAKPLCAQKARLESPLGEDARLCGPRASVLLVFFGGFTSS